MTKHEGSVLWEGTTAGGRSLELLVEADASATVGDLATELARLQRSIRPARGPEGHPLLPDDPTPLSHLLAPTTTVAVTPAWHVHVVAGPDAGHRRSLGEEGLVVGRCSGGPSGRRSGEPQGRDPAGVLAIDDPSVSRRHLRIGLAPDGSVWVHDLDATNTTLLDGEPLPGGEAVRATIGAQLRLGATVITLVDDRRPTDAALPGRTGPDGRSAFHRPPRTTLAPSTPPIAVPAARPAPPPGMRLGVTAIVAPLAMGLVLAVLISPRMALMALSSPILLIGNWLEDRRTNRRRRREGTVTLATEMASFRDALRHAHTEQARRSRSEETDPARCLRLASLPGLSLWERRPNHHDWMVLGIGRGSGSATYALAEPRSERAEGVTAALADRGPLDDVPVTVAFTGGRLVGICGPSEQARGLMRSLVAQAATMHGPADLAIAVIAESDTWGRAGRADQTGSLDRADALDRWRWAARLGHLGPLHRPQLVAVGAEADELASTLLTDRSRPLTFVVIDAPMVMERPDGALHELLADPPPQVAVLVHGTRMDRLPAGCTTVIDATEDGNATVVSTADGARTGPVIPTGISVDTARAIAGALHRWTDPANTDASTGLPDELSLRDLTGPIDSDALMAHWSRSGAASLSAPVGMGPDGPVHIDMCTDGPHALVAGTTGSGKSELLRTLVASIALHHPPDRVTFVLIDYKGGAAFSGLAALPHTVGCVTDLDAGLAQRALTCLEAELLHRERMLHLDGSDDIVGYRGSRPLPRLLVVIDEFATMAADLPDFITSLVGIAQRGRSLGVHLVLATQRPAGAVSDSIRANTNLRIALRVQDSADSTDVIGTAAAASIERRRPGRALVRTGPGEVGTIQTATTSVAPGEATRLRVWALGDPSPPIGGAAPNEAAPDTAAVPAAATDLVTVVQASLEAAARCAIAAPRRPWPDPLPDVIARPGTGAGRVIGMVDRPAEQRQHPLLLAAEPQNLLFLGAAGTGTTSALITCALSIADNDAPDDVHLYGIDFGTLHLSVLRQLPHTGAIVGPSEPDRVERLVRHLSREVARRRHADAGGATHPRIVLLVDGWAGLRAAHDDLAGAGLVDRLHRLLADGPAVGIGVIVAADRPQALGAAAMASFHRRFVLRLADPIDHAMLGVRRPERGKVIPGRCIDVEQGTDCQLAIDADAAAAVARIGERHRSAHRPGVRLHAPAAIESLPEVVTMAQLRQRMALPMPSPSSQPLQPSHATLRALIGLSDEDHQPIGWELGEGEHAVISGPARSGKSTALVAVAHTVALMTPDARVHVLAPRPSPLHQVDGIHHRSAAALADAVDRAVADALAETGHGPVVALVDDADLVDDPTGALAALLARRIPGLWLVAAGRPDGLRSSYTHWTVPLRRSRQGLALRPQLELDGELWLSPLPRRTRHTAHFTAGRGYLVTPGSVELIQVAHPDESEICR